MNVEAKLISKAIQTGYLKDLIAKGITKRSFNNSEVIEIWEFVTKFFATYKKSPTPEIVIEQFPNFDWTVPSEPIEFLLDGLLVKVKGREARGAFEYLADVLNDNEPEQILKIDETFLDKAKDLAQIVPSSNITKFSSMKSRIETYRKRKEEGFQVGISFGIPLLDEVTFGLHPYQYVTIAGWTGIGKSWLGLLFAVNHYLSGHTPMIISLEMDEQEIYDRLDSIVVGLSWYKRHGLTLSPNEMEQWEEWAEKAENLNNDIIVVDVDYATPEKVYAETARWNPDVVIVDYIQLMLAPSHFRNSWERIGYISQMLKAQARQMRIPIYGLAQANVDSVGEGANLTNLAGSKDIGKHSDLVLGLYQNEEMKEKNKMDISVEKNRIGPAGSVIPMKWNPSNSEFRPWKGSDSYPVEEFEV